MRACVCVSVCVCVCVCVCLYKNRPKKILFIGVIMNSFLVEITVNRCKKNYLDVLIVIPARMRFEKQKIF